MSDFHQHGLISTLQNLRDTDSRLLEEELCALATTRPVALILPCHGRDLRQRALKGIIEELSGARFLSEIILSINGVDATEHEHARRLFEGLSCPHRILWNDGPELRPIYEKRGGFVPGKGFNVRAAMELLCGEQKAHLIVTHDCDVISFRRQTLVRLCYSGVHPDMDYHFSKMYYSRVTDRIYGRVSRLFLAPLLHALVHVSGHQPLLDFLLSFRYPLSGECAIRRELAQTLSIADGWGLEIGLLSEVFRKTSPRRVCQVDGGSDYDHKHQPLTGEGGGLYRMSLEIAQTLFAQLQLEGIEITASLLEAVRMVYAKEADEALVRFRNLALINRLAFDLEEERGHVALFSQALAEFALGRTAA